MADDYQEVANVVQLVLARSLELNPGCCGDESWRFHLCPYHQGVMDGAEMALLQLRSEDGPGHT